MSDPIQHLTQVFAQNIPLSQAMGTKVLAWQEQQLQLLFPLAPNINHQSSMFGGSIYCAAVLAGWGWLHLRLRESGIDTTHIVVQAGKIEYLLPISHSAIACCSAPEEQLWQRFLTAFQKHGKARLQLTSHVLTENGDNGAVFTGLFVLHN